jgi:hypothetical protein
MRLNQRTALLLVFDDVSANTTDCQRIYRAMIVRSRPGEE